MHMHIYIHTYRSWGFLHLPVPYSVAYEDYTERFGLEESAEKMGGLCLQTTQGPSLEGNGASKQASAVHVS